MTRTLSTLAVAALSLTLAVPLSYVQNTQAAPKIAYISSKKIMEQTPGLADMEAQLAKELAPFEARLKAIVDSNAAALAKYRTDQPNLTTEGKATREKEITDKQKVWQLKSDSINMKAALRRNEIQAPMMDALKKILNDIRTEDGLWMIIDVNAQNEGGPLDALIVAIDRNMEITDRVLARFKVALAALPKPGVTPSTGAPLNTGTGVGGATRPPPEP